MADNKSQAALAQIQKDVEALSAAFLVFRRAEAGRDANETNRNSQRYSSLVAKLGGLADTVGGEAHDAILKVLAEEKDVTGVDNPAAKEK